MCIVHKISDGYYGIETEAKPADPVVVERMNLIFREALAEQRAQFESYKIHGLTRPRAKRQKVRAAHAAGPTG